MYKILVLTSDDLIEKSKTKPVNELEFWDFKNSMEEFSLCYVMIYFDGKRNKIFKDRYFRGLNEKNIS